MMSLRRQREAQPFPQGRRLVQFFADVDNGVIEHGDGKRHGVASLPGCAVQHSPRNGAEH